MRALSDSELLSVWEQGIGLPPVKRALDLLAGSCSEMPLDELARLSIGQRDYLLFRLRECTFGPQMVCLATCPVCGERLELTFNVGDILAAPEVGPDEDLEVVVSGYALRFRLPNSLDLVAIAGSENTESARDLLLNRCMLAILHKGEQITVDRLPTEVVNAVMELMEKADPQADVRLDLSCPACAHRWEAAFDIVQFFWSEIESWARRILFEVHLLARAYGWCEANILAMSPKRRQIYLEMASG